MPAWLLAAGIVNIVNNTRNCQWARSVLRGARRSSVHLTVNGANFVNGSIVRWNGSDRTTTCEATTDSAITATSPRAGKCHRI
jgi:hypothetical protein